MSTSRQKKQTRILYFCFLILLIVLTVAAAVAGGNKKSGTNPPPIAGTADQGETEKEPAGAGRVRDETGPDTEKTGLIPRRQTESESATEPSPTEPTALEPEPISFCCPVNGELYAAYSGAVPVFSSTMNDYRTHNGVDVAAPSGDPVVACADGVIEEIWDDPMMGKSLKISHGGDFESVYRSLSADLPDGIAVGAAVEKGQTIAAVGSTALIECEDEPHVHFELRQAGKNVDPAEYIVFTAKADYED